MHKDTKHLIRLAEKQGWVVSRTKGDHYRWQSPAGELVFSSSTPSDRRAIKNLRKWLHNAGLDLPEYQRGKKKT